jgi:hypothetical protein
MASHEPPWISFWGFEGKHIYKRSSAMGDKGGRKDKDKSQKQSNEKQKQKDKRKVDKQPKSKLTRTLDSPM